MHVDYKEMLVREPKIEYKTSEANIENRKVNIQLEKVNIGMFGEKISGISKKTIQHMEQLCDSFDKNEIQLIYSVIRKYSTPDDIAKMEKISSYFQ